MKMKIDKNLILNKGFHDPRGDPGGLGASIDIHQSSKVRKKYKKQDDIFLEETEPILMKLTLDQGSFSDLKPDGIDSCSTSQQNFSNVKIPKKLDQANTKRVIIYNIPISEPTRDPDKPKANQEEYKNKRTSDFLQKAEEEPIKNLKSQKMSPKY
jgi:hypothetical protein